MNHWKRITPGVVFLAALVAFSGCVKGGIKYGPPPGQQAVQITGGTRVKLPPAASLPVEIVIRKFTETLGNGYALIGGITYINYFTKGLTEADIKLALLKEAQRYGAEVASISISNKSTFDSSVEFGANVYANGKYIQYPDKHYNTTYPYIEGRAGLYIRDPELAARQLKEGRTRWEKKAAVIRDYQQVLLGKLSKIEDTLRGYDVSVFQVPTEKDHLIDKTASAKRALQTGVDIDSQWLKSGSFVYNWLFNFIFRDNWAKSGVTQMNKIDALVQDASRYAETNSFLFDYVVLNNPEKFIWE